MNLPLHKAHPTLEGPSVKFLHTSRAGSVSHVPSPAQTPYMERARFVSYAPRNTLVQLLKDNKFTIEETTCAHKSSLLRPEAEGRSFLKSHLRLAP